MRTINPDRLYELLPAYIRARDVGQGYPLQALLRVIARQADVVEDNIAQLYDNWFIETCDDWVVPYIGELIGYKPIEVIDDPGISRSPARDRILIPRREVGKTLYYRSRKGTLPVLAELARDVTGWMAAALEFHGQTSSNQFDADQLCQALGIEPSFLKDWISQNIRDKAFSEKRTSVGVFLWRRRCHPVTKASPNYVETQQGEFYTFSPLGNNTPLYVKHELHAGSIELHKLPIPITRQMLQDHLDELYGEGKSLCIYLPESQWPLASEPVIDDEKPNMSNLVPVPKDRIHVDDLSSLRKAKRPHFPEVEDKITIDPQTGRFVFPARPRQRPALEPRVSYYSGFIADIGGGEYRRPLTSPPKPFLIRTRCQDLKSAFDQAICELKRDTKNVLVEITDSGLYLGHLPHIILKPGQTLQIRAANCCRPVIWIVEKSTSLPDSLRILPFPDSCFILDGILVTGRGLHIDEPPMPGVYIQEQKPAHVVIRHSTLVPGWFLKPETAPARSEEASIALNNAFVKLRIQKSIIGSISVAQQDIPRVDPGEVVLEDSILDSTAKEEPAIYGEDTQPAYVSLTVRRSTVLGEVEVRELALAENSIFRDKLTVHNRQVGIIRYSYVPEASDTPHRFRCADDGRTFGFMNVQYGTVNYCRLRDIGGNRKVPHPVMEGAEYGVEMGVYNHLFDPVRQAILQERLADYVPVGVEPKIFYVD